MVLTRAQNQPGPDGILGNGRRHPGRQQHRLALGRPEPDLHLALLAPGVPARVRAERRQPARSRPASCSAAWPPARPTPARPTARTASPPGRRSRSRPRRSSACGSSTRTSTNIPMLAADPYGKFIPGPARGLPQYVTDDRPGRGQPRPRPVPVPANVLHFDTPFLTDIAHNADPCPQDTDNNPATPPVAPTPDARQHRRRPTSRTSRPAPTTTRCSTRTSPAVTAAATRTSR